MVRAGREPTCSSLSRDLLHLDGYAGPKANLVEGEHNLFEFLTCDANALVAPVHPKARPVILTTAEEVDAWLSAPAAEALQLQRALQGSVIRILATGERQDAAPAIRA